MSKPLSFREFSEEISHFIENEKCSEFRKLNETTIVIRDPKFRIPKIEAGGKRTKLQTHELFFPMCGWNVVFVGDVSIPSNVSLNGARITDAGIKGISLDDATSEIDVFDADYWGNIHETTPVLRDCEIDGIYEIDGVWVGGGHTVIKHEEQVWISNSTIDRVPKEGFQVPSMNLSDSKIGSSEVHVPTITGNGIDFNGCDVKVDTFKVINPYFSNSYVDIKTVWLEESKGNEEWEFIDSLLARDFTVRVKSKNSNFPSVRLAFKPTIPNGFIKTTKIDISHLKKETIEFLTMMDEHTREMAWIGTTSADPRRARVVDVDSFGWLKMLFGPTPLEEILTKTNFRSPILDIIENMAIDINAGKKIDPMQVRKDLYHKIDEVFIKLSKRLSGVVPHIYRAKIGSVRMGN